MQGQSKVQYLQNKINILMKLGRESQILREYDEIMRISGEDPEIRFKKAVLLFKMKKMREAAKECEKAIGLNPSVPIYHYGRALALNNMENYPESLKEINEVLRLVSSPSVETRKEGPSRNINDEIERLLQHFEEIDPEDTASKEVVRKDLEESPRQGLGKEENASFSSRANRILMRDEQYLDAQLTETIDDMKKLDMAIRSIDAHFNRLASLNKDLDAGIEQKERRLGDQLLNCTDAQICELLKRYSDVVRVDVSGEEKKNLRKINRVIDSDPNNAELHYGKALFLYTRGEFDEAMREIEIARSLDPASSAYSFGKTLIENRTFDYEQAIKHITNSVVENPDSPPAHYKRGLMLYLLKRFGEAIDEFNNAIELYRFDPRYYYGKVLAKYSLNDAK